jgi:16S rRNA (guanine(966)-N(2))-methyltransferase RsmD
MRIISGSHKGRQIQAPSNLPVRPTTDRAKEAIFNYLQHRFEFENCSVLDLFAGTGNMSYEFASRGCPEVVAVDLDSGCCRFIKQTAEKLGFSAIQVIQNDIFNRFKFQNEHKFDLIFADPPYQHPALKQLPELVLQGNCLVESGLFILEHPRNFNFDPHPQWEESRPYGQSVFSIFTAIAP